MSQYTRSIVVLAEATDPITVRSTNVDINGHIFIVTDSPDTAERLAQALLTFAANYRAIPTRPCYECGDQVALHEGEQHGRSGWVHWRCMADD